MANWKNIALYSVIGLVVLATLGFVDGTTATLKSKDLTINIDHHSGNYFVLEEDIRELFYDLGFEEGKLINDIDIRQLEKMLQKYPSVLNAEVYATIDGHLSADITQRKPVLRVFNDKGGSYYIDEEGLLMPLSRKYTSRVMVASGNIMETYAASYHQNLNELPEDTASVLRDIYKLASFIHQDPFWSAQIIQLHVTPQKEIEMVPRVGNHKILLGQVNDLPEKFSKLRTFYDEGLSKTGWNEYGYINLKFKNQVVCNKR